MASYVKSHATITLLDVSLFKPHEDARHLHEAMQGKGTNDKAIIDILGNRSNQQRQLISEAYKEQYHKSLMDALKAELKGPFEDLIVALMTPSADFDAQLIHKATKGFGTDEALLTEVLITRTYLEMQRIKESYKKLFGKDVAKIIEKDTSGDYKKLCLMLFARGGDHDIDVNVDRAAAVRDAELLYKCSEGKMGTDEGGFFNILTGRTYDHLRVVFEEYQKARKHSIDEAIKKEFSGDAKKMLLEFVHVIRNTAEYFAEKLHKAITGKHDKTTTRIIVSRAEIDLEDTKREFARLYRKSLAECVEENVTGPTRVMLKSLIR